jgi:predicted aspartyl protease
MRFAMPAYDATFFDPPVPLAMVAVRSPTTGESVDNVAMLIDTGADVTILPRAQVERLVETAPLAGRYELEGFDGRRSLASAVRLELQFLGKVFRGQFLIVDGRHGVLGRNVINSLSLIMDGPKLIWRETK